MDYTSAVSILILLAGALSQAPSAGKFFYCSRRGQNCENGTCQPNEGTCNCSSGYKQVKEYHCLAVSAENCGNPNKTCSSNGDCYENNCYCNQTYYGEDCQHPRIQLTCASTGMQIAVTPHRTFQGRIYASDKSWDSNCQLKDLNNNGTWRHNFSYVSSDATSCGIIGEQFQLPAEQQNGMTSGTRYTLKIIVQYNAYIIINSDQVLVFTCVFSKEKTFIGEFLNANASGALNQGTGEGTGVPLKFSIIDDSASSTVGAEDIVTVGDNLTISIRLEENSVFTHFLVQKCTASNMVDKDNLAYHNLTIVDEGGCPAQNVVVRGPHEWQTSEVRIPLIAFMFAVGSRNLRNTLYISCDVKFCDDADRASCQPRNCSNTIGYGRRRRREAGDGDSTQVGQIIKVLFGERSLRVDDEKPPSTVPSMTTLQDCLRHPQLQPIIVILAVLLLLVIFATFFLVLIFDRRSRRHGVNSAK